MFSGVIFRTHGACIINMVYGSPTRYTRSTVKFSMLTPFTWCEDMPRSHRGKEAGRFAHDDWAARTRKSRGWTSRHGVGYVTTRSNVGLVLPSSYYVDRKRGQAGTFAFGGRARQRLSAQVSSTTYKEKRNITVILSIDNLLQRQKLYPESYGRGR